MISLRPLIVEQCAPYAARFGAAAGEVTEILAELIVGLSALQEEGFAYAPLVFVTSDLGPMLEQLHATDPIFVGSHPSPVATARAALKQCAPLGEGRRWALFLLVRDGSLEFGLFRPQGAPLRPTSYELLRRGTGAGPAIVGLARLRTGMVEVRTSDGGGGFFDLTGSAEGTPHSGSAVRTFVRAVTLHAPERHRAQFEAFYYRIVVEVLTGGHGALAAILAPGTEAPAFLSDGIWFAEPVDIETWIRRDERGETAEGAHAMLAFSQLIRRMMGMDGITVFGSDGTVRAYSCFLHQPRLQAENTFLLGGARRRAYGYLKSQLGEVLLGAFIRSQDGAAECTLAPHLRP